MKYLLLAASFLTPMSIAFASDVMPLKNVVQNQIQYDHVVWNGIPISFVAPVGHERILRFPSSVSLHNTNPNLTTNKVSILNNNGFLYVTAKKPFSAIRIPFVIKKTGEVVLVDLSAKNNAKSAPVSVVLQTNDNPNSNSNASGKKPQFVNFVSLMRYAIQHVYSPERLITQNTLITRAPMYTTKSVDLFNNSNVVAMPLVSWRGGNLYVTAVLLKNVWNQTVKLDPRNINGNWLSASFYPRNSLQENGSKHDRTTLFLISNQPFNGALNQMRGYV